MKQVLQNFEAELRKKTLYCSTQIYQPKVSQEDQKEVIFGVELRKKQHAANTASRYKPSCIWF